MLAVRGLIEFAFTCDMNHIHHLLSFVRSIDSALKVLDSYSGRNMFGVKSPLAFRSSVHPRTTEGQSILDHGFQVDNLGLDWVYYLHKSSI